MTTSPTAADDSEAGGGQTTPLKPAGALRNISIHRRLVKPEAEFTRRDIIRIYSQLTANEIVFATKPCVRYRGDTHRRFTYPLFVSRRPALARLEGWRVTKESSLSAERPAVAEFARVMGAETPSRRPWSMCRLYLLVLLKFLAEQLVFCANLTVGYLTADRTKTFVKNKQGRIISGAMSYAIQTVGTVNG